MSGARSRVERWRQGVGYREEGLPCNVVKEERGMFKTGPRVTKECDVLPGGT